MTYRTLAGAFVCLALATISIAGSALAQEPDTTAAAPADTAETLEELEERLLGELGEADTSRAAEAARTTQQAGTLNPDISLIGDFVADLSPEESTLEEGDRFLLREIEIGIQGAVDPYFRYDAFIGFHGEEAEVEEAYATTLALPAGLQARVGKMLLPFGKVNLTHVPELHTIDLPLLHQEYFGEEGLASTGVWLSWLGDPLGIVQEVSVTATNGAERHGHGEEEEHGEEEHEEEEHGEERDLLEDLGDRLWVTHLKNSIDLTPASNLEVGASWGTSAVGEADVRTTLYGLDVTWRWKPPGREKYRSAIVQAEVAWRDEEDAGETWTGAFLFGQWQLARRWYVGGRYDWVEPLEAPDEPLQAGQILLRYFPTEFSQLRLAYERRVPDVGDAIDRVLFQTTFALGPHRPHPF
ncbi:MAG: hypothetical protein R3199_05825 [Gemmatimonadota bacterium]|nr:hypothetical protein [Gemmatimonadota bacterium]